jgi:predicted MFS family arabinose efflux permease
LKLSLRVQVLIFAVVRVVFNTMHRMVYPFLPAFSRGLGIDLSGMSFALTLRALAGGIGPFLAYIADVRGRKTGMLFGVLLFILGVIFVVLWPSFTTFLLALVLTTVGYLTFIPSMQAYLGDRVPYERRGRALAITEMGWSLSFIIGVPLAGFMISRWGWIAPFPLLVILGFLSLLLLSWMLPSDPAPTDNPPKLWGNLKVVLTSPITLSGLGITLLCSTANELVILVFGVWMEDSFGMNITALGMAAIAIGIAELSGEALVGGFTDRLGKVRAVAIGLILNCLALLVLSGFGRWQVGALVGLFAFFLTFEFTIVSAIPMMTELLPIARATLMAANIAFISLGRAIGATLAYPIYTLAPLPGITANALVAVLFNLLSLASLGLVYYLTSVKGTSQTQL